MIGVNLTGADGSNWDLRSGPIVLLMEGVEGFGDPKWTRPTQSSPSMDGQRRTNPRSTAAPREGFLPLDMLRQDDELAWFNLNRAWWKAWTPDAPSTLTVTAPDGSERHINCYLSDDNGYSPTMDPTVDLSDRVDVSWVADDPWWRGPSVTQAIYMADAGDFLGGSAGAPPFIISPSSASTSGTITNPGDVAAWATWRITEGATSFSVSINGHTVGGNIVVPTGSTLVIDTQRQVALLYAANGSYTNVTPQLTQVDFAQVPAGTSATLVASLNGSLSATIQMEFEPRYRRAW